MELVGDEAEVYDTYPPPDENFVYRDPYVTDDEMLQIKGAGDADQIKPIRPRKPASAYFFYVKQQRCRLQQQHPR